MALVRNENFVRLLLMKLMTVVATIVVLGQLLVSCIKKGPWSLFHVEPRHRQPDISRSKRFGIHGFAQFEVKYELFTNVFIIINKIFFQSDVKVNKISNQIKIYSSKCKDKISA